jgi:hypothetical protein
MRSDEVHKWYVDFKSPKYSKPERQMNNELLDDVPKTCSARYRAKIGKPTLRLKLKDKIVFPMDVCPHCGGSSTFHAFVLSHKNVVDNVWNTKTIKSEKGRFYAKFDYCFNCHKEFMIEAFLHEVDEDADN